MTETPMTANDPAQTPQAGLMRSLSRLVRGLSALFWGLPITLVVCVQTARTNILGSFGILPPLLATGLLLYGLFEMGHFQRQERVWRLALDRTILLGWVSLGLAPFLYWWKLMPEVLHFKLAVALMALSGLMFLFNLNQVLQRLSAMLPDETLRMETRMFTTLNLYLVLGILVLAAVWVGLRQWQPPPYPLQIFFMLATRLGVLAVLVLLLLPVAMTMALIWKIKETILASVFGPG